MGIEILPGAPVSPEVLLHRLLEDMSQTKGVIVLSLDENGAVQIYTSQITLSSLAYATMRLQSYATKSIDGEPPEGAEFFAPKGAA
mgnify:CR=1 FL=1